MSASTLPSLDELRRLGILRDLDLHFARTLARLTGEVDPLVLLGAAVASRAPGAGHVCAELRAMGGLVRLEHDGEEGERIAWPDAEAWIAALRGSACVGAADEEPRPLLLDGDRLYLRRYWNYQQRLLAALGTRVAVEMHGVNEALLAEGLERLFPDAEGVRREDGTLSEHRQRVAACVAVLRSLAVVTGGPGTGKTTTVVRIIALLLEQAQQADPQRKLRIALAAPTGKAAARMVEAIRNGASNPGIPGGVRAAIPDSASTLHRLLGVDPDRPTRLRHHAGNPLAADVVVVDEASMVDLAMFARLVDAVPPHARLILLGDRDQLTSVEAGAILGDICGSGEAGFSPAFSDRVRRMAGVGPPVTTPGSDAGMWECVVRLTHSHRFDPNGGIGGLARAINSGDGDHAVALLEDADGREAGEGQLAWIRSSAAARDASCIRELVVEGYAAYLKQHDPLGALRALDGFRVLCAHRRGTFGVHELNAQIPAWLREKRLLPRAGDAGEWWHGRPVIVTENDYQLELFNGDTGLILVRDGMPRAWFRSADGEGVRSISPTRLPRYESVFAMTVHKSQGSEFAAVALVLPPRPSPILTRELLYTGVTRARMRVTVVGSADVLRLGVAEQVQRASGIRDALWAGVSHMVAGVEAVAGS